MSTKPHGRPSEQQISELLSTYEAGDWQSARSLAWEMAITFPLFSMGHTVLASIEDLLGNSVRAISLLKTATCLIPHEAEAYLNIGHAMRRLEKLDAAQLLYNRALCISPYKAEIYYFIGATKSQHGHSVMAERALRSSICLKPELPETYSHLQPLLYHSGQLDGAKWNGEREVRLNPWLAEAYCRLSHSYLGLYELRNSRIVLKRSLSINPGTYDGALLFGALNRITGRHEESELWLRRAIQFSYNAKDALVEIAYLYQDKNDHKASHIYFLEAIRKNPHDADLYFALSTTHLTNQRRRESDDFLRKAIILRPSASIFLQRMGNILFDLGNIYGSISWLKRSITLDPENPELYNDLGISLHFKGSLLDAKFAYNRALTFNQNFAEAYCNLSNTLSALGQIQEFERACIKAIALKPDLPDSYSNLGGTFKDQCNLVDSQMAYKRATTVDPLMLDAYSNRLYTLSFMDGFTPESYLKELNLFDQALKLRGINKYHYWLAKSSPQLKVGIVSGDLRSHSVGFFLEGVIREINPERFELIAYPTLPAEDELTNRIKLKIKAWRPVYGLSDAEAADMIWKDGVDILLDLSGHTYGNRLGIFGLKPAPIQISWLGWWASTGVSEMDYLIGDPHVTPRSEWHHFTEKVWQLPETRFCFTPPSLNICVNQLPALSNRFLTFGCFNDLSKINSSVIELWSNIFNRLPTARLFLKSRQLSDERQRDILLSKFEKYRISRDRIFTEGFSSLEDYYRSYHKVDITLDTFPYPGGTTTVQSLWMGVPVITLAGDRLLSHQGEGILKCATLGDWVAKDKLEYIDKALLWSSSIEQLQSQRLCLRDHVLASCLFDSKRFARNFENALMGINRNATKIIN